MYCAPKLKLVLLGIALLSVDMRNSLAREEKFLRADYEHKIKLLTEFVSRLETEKKEAEITYGTSLKKIVQALHDRDLFVGGGTETGGKEVTRLYEAILNEAVDDYHDLIADVSKYFDVRKSYREKVPSIWPLAYNQQTRITSGYGWRLSPFGAWVSFHSGIDLMSEEWNAKVLATADGTVVENWPPPDGYWRGHPELGGTLRIVHGDGYVTTYGHLSRIGDPDAKEAMLRFIAEGQVVKRGQVIGIVGNTGMSRGRHLHYEVHRWGKPVNPVDTLRF